MLLGVDLEHADVGEDVPADDLRADALTIDELDEDLGGHFDRLIAAANACGGDHVGVGQNMTLGGDHETRALRLGTRNLVVEICVDRHNAWGAIPIERGRVEAAGGPARSRRWGAAARRPLLRGVRAGEHDDRLVPTQPLCLLGDGQGDRSATCGRKRSYERQRRRAAPERAALARRWGGRCPVRPRIEHQVCG